MEDSQTIIDDHQGDNDLKGPLKTANWFLKLFENYVKKENIESYQKIGTAWNAFIYLIAGIGVLVIVILFIAFFKQSSLLLAVPGVLFIANFYYLHLLRLDNKSPLGKIEVEESGYKYLEPLSDLLEDSLVSFNNTSAILYGVDETFYSEAAEKIISESYGEHTSYTILSISPKEIFEQIFSYVAKSANSLIKSHLEDYNKVQNESERHLKDKRFLEFILKFHKQKSDSELESFYSASLDNFKHFKVFEEKRENIKRVVLANSEEWFDINSIYLYYFLRYINGKMECYILTENFLKETYAFKDDYVLFNDSISLVYFPRSKTLNFQYIEKSNSQILNVLKAIPDTAIRQHKAKYVFKLENGDFSSNRVLNYFKSIVDEYYTELIKETKSLLYHGYQQADKINSIVMQRDLQARIIKEHIKINELKKLKFLSVGCGFGNELFSFFESGCFSQGIECQIDAIDNSEAIKRNEIARIIGFPETWQTGKTKIYQNKKEQLLREFTSLSGEELEKLKEEVKSLEDRIDFIKDFDVQLNFFHKDLLDLDIIDITKMNRKITGLYDIVQCGFILEDIPYGKKNKAIRAILDLTKPGGLVIISEMFLDNQKKDDEPEEIIRKANIIKLYSSFLSEAGIQLNDDNDILDLCKDGNDLGLLKCMIDSINAKRDYFQNVEDLIKVLVDFGFKREEINVYGHSSIDLDENMINYNLKSGNLKVLTFSKPIK